MHVIFNWMRRREQYNFSAFLPDSLRQCCSISHDDGDIFDTVTTRMKWLAQLGDVGYTFLLWLNRIYNVYRARHGQPYYSLSQAIKQKVKSAVSYISDFEEELVKFARARK